MGSPPRFCHNHPLTQRGVATYLVTPPPWTQEGSSTQFRYPHLLTQRILPVCYTLLCARGLSLQFCYALFGTREGSPLFCFTFLDTRWGRPPVTQGRPSSPAYGVESWGGRGAVLLHPSFDARARVATTPLDTRGGGPLLRYIPLTE